MGILRTVLVAVLVQAAAPVRAADAPIHVGISCSAHGEISPNGDLTLDPADWTDAATTPQEAGGRKQVIVSPPAGSRFYRLLKP